MKSRNIIALLVLAIGVVGIMVYIAFTKNIEKQTKQQTPASKSQIDYAKIPNANVKYTTSGFEPKILEVSKNTRVIWVNETNKKVTVHSDDHPTHAKNPQLNLGEFEKNFSVQLVFDKPGTYGYHNHLNPEDRGEIVVK